MRSLPPIIVAALLPALLVTVPIPARAESLEAAREKIERMSPEERAKLRRRWEQFQDLPGSERKRLRRMHRELSRDPAADELRSVMEKYHDWLRTLPPLTRSELLDLEPAERIERIKQLRERQRLEDIKQLDEVKVKVLGRWLAEQTERLMDQLPEPARARIEGIEDPRARWWATAMMWKRAQRGGGMFRLMRAEDLAELRSALPEPVADEMARHSVEDQWKLVGNWVKQLLRRRWGSGPDEGAPGPEFGDRLADFFENEVSDAEAGRLMEMPPDQMRSELLRLYFERNGRRPEHMGPPPGRGPGHGRRGPGRSPPRAPPRPDGR